MICQIEGRGTVAVRTAQYWFKKFNEDDTSLENAAIPDNPLIVDDSGAILNIVEENQPTCTLRLSSRHTDAADKSHMNWR